MVKHWDNWCPFRVFSIRFSLIKYKNQLMIHIQYATAIFFTDDCRVWSNFVCVFRENRGENIEYRKSVPEDALLHNPVIETSPDFWRQHSNSQIPILYSKPHCKAHVNQQILGISEGIIIILKILQIYEPSCKLHMKYYRHQWNVSLELFTLEFIIPGSQQICAWH